MYFFFFVCIRCLSSIMFFSWSLWWWHLSLWRGLERSWVWCSIWWMSSAWMYRSWTMYWRRVPLWTWMERTILWSTWVKYYFIVYLFFLVNIFFFFYILSLDKYLPTLIYLCSVCRVHYFFFFFFFYKCTQ